MLKQSNPDVALQALLLMKKMTENEKSKVEIDLKNLPTLIEILKSKDLRIVE